MGRPRKSRQIRLNASVRYYKPQGVPIRELKVVLLKEEELEALALADANGLAHTEAAALMNVSRPTFSRVLKHARSVVASALIEGAALRIGGGDFERISETSDGNCCG